MEGKLECIVLCCGREGCTPCAGLCVPCKVGLQDDQPERWNGRLAAAYWNFMLSGRV